MDLGRMEYAYEETDCSLSKPSEITTPTYQAISK